jgi:isoleucyl-tRNA synthetase
MAPIAPFFADWLFNNLNSITQKNIERSIHLTNFPVYEEKDINRPLEDRMQLAQDISSLILSLRKKVNIKVRQPLQKVIIPAVDADFEKKIRLVENIIKSETNIKEVEILESGYNFIKKKAKANFKTLGKRLGAKMKVVAKAVENLDDASINNIQQGNFMLKLDENETVAISSEDIEVSTNEIPGFEIAVKGSLTVALDLQMTDTLKKEGFAREFINRIQNLRKENDFQLTDKILLKVQEKEGLKDIITEFNEYICAEILADSIEYSPEILNGIKIDVNNDTFTVKISKKSY